MFIIEHMTCATWVNLNILFCVKTATVFSLSPMRLLSGGLMCPSQSSGALEGSGRRQEVPLRGTIEKWPRAQGTWPDYATWWTTLSSSWRSILPTIVSNHSNRSFGSNDFIAEIYNKLQSVGSQPRPWGVNFSCELLLDHPGAIFCQRTLWCGRDRLLRPSGRTWSLQPQSLLVLPHQVFAKFKGGIALWEWIHRCVRYFPSQQCMSESRWLSWFVTTEHKKQFSKKVFIFSVNETYPKFCAPTHGDGQLSPSMLAIISPTFTKALVFHQIALFTPL